MIKQSNIIIYDSEDTTSTSTLQSAGLQAVTQDGGNNVGMKCEIVMADTG